jgi:hypothetical protein
MRRRGRRRRRARVKRKGRGRGWRRRRARAPVLIHGFLSTQTPTHTIVLMSDAKAIDYIALIHHTRPYWSYYYTP